jgi:histidine triad (HIT) family protein
MTDNGKNCIFCKIAAGDLGTDFVVESDHVVAFDDISPQAPTHVQVIPKRHVDSIEGLDQADADLWVEMLMAVRKVAEARGLQESGYRIVSNSGPDSGQEVPHLHIHVLGGTKLGPIA